MEEIIRGGIRQQIYDIIKERILSAEYRLGDPVNIVSLSKELAVSNTPIREAVSMLCAEGLIVSNVNHKFRVMELTEKKMSELNETFLILLSGAYTCCCHNGKNAGLADLLQTAFDEQSEAFRQNEMIPYIRKAIAFDRCFVSVCENDRLLSVFDNQSNQLFLSVRYAYRHADLAMASNLEEHRALLAAARADEQETVQQLLRQHYDKHFFIDD